MSLGLKIGLGAFVVCFVISLIIAIPLQTAGYDTHVVKNEALVATECRVKEYLVTPDTCFHSCNCVVVCIPKCTTSTINGHTTTNCNNQCNNQCQSCPYTCYNADWLVEYSLIDQFGNPVLNQNGTELSYKLGTPMKHFDLVQMAQSALDSRPIGSVFVCYYDSSNLGDVRLEKYDLSGFYASYIVFYIFAAISAVGIISLGVYILVKV